MEHSKNDEGIKEGGSSGIHLAHTYSSPCLQFVYKGRESVSIRLLIRKTHNSQSDIALVSTAGESRVYRHFQSRGNNATETVFNLQLT